MLAIGMPLIPHPDQAAISGRLRKVGRSADIKFEQELFRFINPAFSKADDIISGEGARYTDGRWNVIGLSRLTYTAMTPKTALEEALAHVRYFNLPESKALPRVLVAVKLRASRVLDLRDGKIRRILRLSEHTIRHVDWRKENLLGREAITQAWGFAFAHVGRFEAVMVPSAADAAGANGLIFPQNLQAGSEFRVLTEGEA
jgi:RES domain-containing protein